MRYVVHVDVLPKEGILDPQGKAVEEALPALGFSGVEKVRVGKHIVLEMDGNSAEEVLARAEEMARKFLSNPVIEEFRVRLGGAAGEGRSG